MGKKGNKRKTRWRVLPIGGDDAECLYSTNEDDGDGDHAASSPTAPNGPGSYARAAQPGRGKLGSKSRSSSYQSTYYNRPHRSAPESRQPLVTTEKKTFNEEEYTKITTPRQDVLFKKGYLGRKKTVPSGTPASDATTAAVTGVGLTSNSTELAPMHNGEDCELVPGEQSEAMNPSEEQPQYVYTNGYMDGVIYVNGGYEWYDPYNMTVLVGPPPPFAGPGAAPPVLAAVPCQPLPLQPLEWFNPTYGVPYMATSVHSCPRERDRRKRFSTDSQNCSPQSSESTDPAGSPQEGEGEVECEGEGEGEGELEEGLLPVLPDMTNGTDEYSVYSHSHTMQPHPPPPPQAYMYPGAYMFGQPIYSMNGITVQSTSQLPPNTENSGSKRRKKKRRRRRRRGGVEDGSEDTSSDEKDLEDPGSLTSQESSQEAESETKNSQESASCSIVVGCPDLPKVVPESQSSSPSLSPSLSSSPSPSNATEDKTALSKINGADADLFPEQQILRSDLSSENKVIVTKVSATSVEENPFTTLHISKDEDDHDNDDGVVCPENKDTNLEILINQQNGNCNLELVNDVCKANGNHPVEYNKSFELDDNCVETAHFESQNSESLRETILLDDRNLTNCKESNSRQKAKNKRLKCNQQKIHHFAQNGEASLEVNNHSLNDEEISIRMDGNEEARSNKDSSEKSSDVILKKQNSQEKESTTSQLQEVYDTKNSSQVSNATEVPKKPTRTHQHRQLRKNQASEKINKSLEKQEHKSSSSFVDQGDKYSSKELIVSDPCTSSHLDKSIDFSEASTNTMKIVSDVLKTDEKNNSLKDEIAELESNLPHKEDSLVVKVQNDPPVELDESNIQDKTICNILDVKNVNESTGTEIHLDRVRNDSLKLDTFNRNEGDNTKTEEYRQKDEVTSQAYTEKQKTFSLPVESLDSTPPVPPPRRKKWQPLRRCSVEPPPAQRKEMEVKKVIDVVDDSSCSSSQSDESVIELHQSSLQIKKEDSENVQEGSTVLFDTPDIPKSILPNQTKIISAAKEDVSKEVKESNLVDSSKLKCNKSVLTGENIKSCISSETEEIFKGDQIIQMYSENDGVQAQGTSYIPGELSTNSNTLFYAEDLATRLLGSGLSTAVTGINRPYPTQSLSLTEVVTQWLQSQDSEELLPVPPSNESENEVEEVGEEEIMTGPKNVHRNPLLAPSCNGESVHDCAGIRVAKNLNSLSNEKEIGHTKKGDNSSSAIIHNGCYVAGKLIEQKVHDITISNVNYNKNVCYKIANGNSFIYSEEYGSNNCKYENDIESTKPKNHKYTTGLEENDQFKCESDEYDPEWECEPNSLKISGISRFHHDDPTSYAILEGVENNCSSMCDPTISVAKYYSLGVLSEKEVYDREKLSSNDSGRDDSEEMDALIHFKNELMDQSNLWETDELLSSRNSVRKEENLLGKSELYKKCRGNGGSSCVTADSGVQSEESSNEKSENMKFERTKPLAEINSVLNRKSAILISQLVADGPFPCGGICCILQ